MNFILANVINPVEAGSPNLIGQFIQWIDGLFGNFAIAVIVFSVFLKVITLPLDVWQRVSMKKSSLQMEGLKTRFSEIDKQYASDPQRANREKQKLQKEQGISTFSSCLPMLVTMALFIFMFSGLRSYSTYSNLVVYNNLVVEYNTAYNYSYCGNNEDNWLEPHKFQTDVILRSGKALKAESLEEMINLFTEIKEVYGESHPELANEIDQTMSAGLSQGATDSEKKASLTESIRAFNKKYTNTLAERDKTASDYAKKMVGESFKEHGEGFLWINNIFQPDSWKPIFPEYAESGVDALEEDLSGHATGYTPNKKVGYNLIHQAVTDYNPGYFGGWNGLMILPITSILLTFLSTFIMQKQNPNAAANTQSNKITMWMMPVLIAFFVFTYTASFAIYMVANSVVSLLSTLFLNPIINKRANKKVMDIKQADMPEYSRYKKK